VAAPDREPPAGGPDRPPGQGQSDESLRRSPVLRVFFYYFATLLLVSFGVQFLILGTLGPEAIEKLAKGEKGVIDVPLLLLFQTLLLPPVLFLTSYFARVRDRRPLAELGLAWPAGTGRSLVFGGALAAVLLCFWRLLAGWLLQFEVRPVAADLETPWLPLGASGLALVLAGLLSSALLDEIIFRGYLYSTLREKFSWVHAAGLTNLLYLTFNATSPEAGAQALINVFLLGLVLAGLRERTGSLAAGTIFQTVWNLMLGTIFSMRLSGFDFPRLEDVRLKGDSQLSGGDYGPEGGWLVTAVLVLGLAAIVAWVERGKNEAAPAEA
jgi:uncharacterized protein